MKQAATLYLCCSDTLLQQMFGGQAQWFYPTCRQAMPAPRAASLDTQLSSTALN
ncbi:hypothetical protein PGN35_020335 [Nodosilinea sp. PGN35]|uniref:hypothetical protein n=1 Tax=Nodosilinea sp. PGN35 TaxID=3020489 RepID=UPI0023B32F26|nr:hypothetical protein [Nodosilinea sp. TSF1-S3]MDF0369795.1 hypothetical protein [Nodosilinea sp. TSF1-S3]